MLKPEKPGRTYRRTDLAVLRWCYGVTDRTLEGMIILFSVGLEQKSEPCLFQML